MIHFESSLDIAIVYNNKMLGKRREFSSCVRYEWEAGRGILELVLSYKQIALKSVFGIW